jgi:hypothetical protein
MLLLLLLLLLVVVVVAESGEPSGTALRLGLLAGSTSALALASSI